MVPDLTVVIEPRRSSDVYPSSVGHLALSPIVRRVGDRAEDTEAHRRGISDGATLTASCARHRSKQPRCSQDGPEAFTESES